MIHTIMLLAFDGGATPSFDCTKARTQIEHAICGDQDLSELDREEARLYRRALAAAPGQRTGLIARQREFLKVRNECVGSSAPLSECLRDAYMADISDLQRFARPEGMEGGISSPPIRFRCDGGYPDAYVTRFDLREAQAWISVPTLNEGQPLIADSLDPQHFVGRYNRAQTFDARTSVLRIDARLCTRAA